MECYLRIPYDFFGSHRCFLSLCSNSFLWMRPLFPLSLGWQFFDRCVSSVQELPLLSVQQPKKLVTWVEGRWLIFCFCLVQWDPNFISLVPPHHHPVQQFSACGWDLWGLTVPFTGVTYQIILHSRYLYYNLWQ